MLAEVDKGYVLFYLFISWEELINPLTISNKMERFNYKGEHLISPSIVLHEVSQFLLSKINKCNSIFIGDYFLWCFNYKLY